MKDLSQWSPMRTVKSDFIYFLHMKGEVTRSVEEYSKNYAKFILKNYPKLFSYCIIKRCMNKAEYVFILFYLKYYSEIFCLKKYSFLICLINFYLLLCGEL